MNITKPSQVHVPTVLFICVHNAGRSIMAEAFATELIKKRGLNLRARSAGTDPEKEINPAVTQAMVEAGVSMTARVPHLLTQEEADRASWVVTMGCGIDAAACPFLLHVQEDWRIDDPAGQPVEKVRVIRDEIQMRVEKLVDGLEQEL